MGHPKARILSLERGEDKRIKTTMENNKKTVICAIIILSILTTYLLLANLSSRKNLDNTGNNQTTTPRDNKLSNRDIAIQEVLANPDKLLRRTQINGETYLLTGYDDVFYGDNNKKENKSGQKFGGLIVFKLENGKPILFWESTEYINVGRVGGLIDINNDGIKEIVWEYDLGVTGRNNSFYVYKFAGDGFKLVTPMKIVELTTPLGITLKYNRTLIGGDSSLTYMSDIDNDGIQEITVGDWMGVIGDNAGGKDIKIYKYDGDKYYLWKEDKTGE